MSRQKRHLISILSIILILGGIILFKTTSETNNSSPTPQELQKPANSPAPSNSSINTTDKKLFHIGIMTGTVYQAEDGLLGAQEVIKKYGLVSEGGIIEHVTYPDNFMAEMETTIERLVNLANDPLMKVIVVNQAVPGTAEGFRQIRNKKPNIILLAAEAHEDPDIIASTADLVVDSDFLSRGYLIPHSAKKLGAKNFVHISFPRHMISENLRIRRVIMEEASKDLGINFIFENAPDPTGEAGVEGARQYIMDMFPTWIKQYGPDTAFFSTNESHIEPLLKQISKYGGYFVEADLPSPMIGYPGAFNVDITDYMNDPPKLLSLIEEAVIKAGASNRMGTWSYSLAFCQTAGMVEFGKLIAEGQAVISDTKTLLDCFAEYSPGVKWNGSYYSDFTTASKSLKNYFLIYQDTYIFGQGYLGVTDIEVPEKYRLQALNQPHKTNTAPFHIGIVTGNYQNFDDREGALEMIRLYGDADSGGLIKLHYYPDDFMSNMNVTVDIISKLADDPLMKIIVVNQAVPGTADAFRQVKQKRPDIILLAGEAHEDPDLISSVTDLVVNSDFISRGYLIPHSAKELGAKTFVHISLPRHMTYKSMLRRRAIMKQAADDLGLDFAHEDAPDPTAEGGILVAQQYITDMFPKWIEKYGTDTAFFCTNDSHTEPLLRQIAKLGGYFIEADIPSPLMGYPEAFNINIKSAPNDWQGQMQEIEQVVVKAGGSGRLGTWAYSLGFTQSAGLAEFGRLIAEGRTKITDTKTLLECFEKFTPGAKWNGTFYIDDVTAKPLRNYFLIYQDTYIFDKGYLKATSVDIPEKYLFIGTKQ